MSQNTSAEWSKAHRISFRFFFSYLVLYFFFTEGFLLSKFAWLASLHTPFASIAKSFIDFVSANFPWTKFFPYADILCCFTLAFIATIVWSVLDKRKSYPTLLKYLHTFSRYYLAFVLLSYGLWKLTLLQFPSPWPSLLIVPLGNLRPFILFWNFTGTSASYQFFAGLMEVIPAVLLLFRRTSTLGALIAIGVLTHILMLNIGYEVFVIPFILQLLFIALFIISPDLKRLYNILVVHKTQPLPVMPIAIAQNRFRWIRYGLKLSLIAYVLFVYVNEINDVLQTRSGNLSFYKLHGIYNVKAFYRNGQSLPPLTTDSIRWNKMAIDGIGGASIVFMNDSSEYYYNIKVDTVAKTFEFYNDSTAKNELHYTVTNPNQYVFVGTFNKDTIRFVADKVDLTTLPLLKNRNKVKWTW